jgi:N-methylhydantoinase B
LIERTKNSRANLDRMDLGVSSSRESRPPNSVSIDPITFEVLANAFTAVVDDMGAMIEKVAFSTVVSIGKDYVSGLAKPTGEVFARGIGALPLITGTAGTRLRALLEIIPEDEIDDGDVFLISDPYLGGTHGQDVAAVMPVFVDGDIVCYVMSASHWPDTGGPVGGSFNSEADSTYAESFLITPIHIMREWRIDEEVQSLILRNARVPMIIKGDLRGMIEACRTGREQFLRLNAKYGRDLLEAMMDELLDYSERLLRAEVEALPDGTYSFTDYIDCDPGAATEDPIPVGLDLTIAGSNLILDFTRSGPQAIGPVNSPWSATQAVAMAALKAIFYMVPWNDGFERVVDLVLPASSIVNSDFPRPVSGVAASPAEKVLASVHGCMVQILPERSMACPTNLVNISLYGNDSRPGRNEAPFVVYLWLAGGWGGRPGRRDAHTTVYPMGPTTNLQPVELTERVYPIRFDRYELKSDSEGAGYHRGGFALHCPWRLTHGEVRVNVQGDRQKLNGWGLEGGQPGDANDLIYAPGTPDEKRIGVMSANNKVPAGVQVYCRQSGGAGWRDPLTRPAAWVLEDVQNELVSIERAKQVYGVVIDPALDLLEATVNEAATRMERERRMA